MGKSSKSTTPHGALPCGTGGLKRPARGSPATLSGGAVAVGVGVGDGVSVEVGVSDGTGVNVGDVVAAGEAETRAITAGRPGVPAGKAEPATGAARPQAESRASKI